MGFTVYAFNVNINIANMILLGVGHGWEWGAWEGGCGSEALRGTGYIM